MARPLKGMTFWDRVYSQVERVGECLLFTGCKDDCGYGRINRDGNLVRIHRAVWERDNGPIPVDKVIMHACDNPACIEPNHLSAGTQAENIKDMDAKNRRITLIGVAQGMAKLCDHDIPIIRHWISDGYATSLIAKAFGVSDGAIQHVKKGRRWTHVPHEAHQ